GGFCCVIFIDVFIFFIRPIGFLHCSTSISQSRYFLALCKSVTPFFSGYRSMYFLMFPLRNPTYSSCVELFCIFSIVSSPYLRECARFSASSVLSIRKLQ